jgi:hypothetical protein
MDTAYHHFHSFFGHLFVQLQLKMNMHHENHKVHLVRTAEDASSHLAILILLKSNCVFANQQQALHRAI